MKAFLELKNFFRKDVLTEERGFLSFHSQPMKTEVLWSKRLFSAFPKRLCQHFITPVKTLFLSVSILAVLQVNVISMYLELLGLRECPSLSCSLDTANKQLSPTSGSCVSKRSRSKTTLLITLCG